MWLCVMSECVMVCNARMSDGVRYYTVLFCDIRMCDGT